MNRLSNDQPEKQKDIHLRMPWRDGRKGRWKLAANGKPLGLWAVTVLDAAAAAELGCKPEETK